MNVLNAKKDIKLEYSDVKGLALAEFSFDVTLIQTCFRFLGKIHFTIKEALYRVTLEETI